MTIRKHAVQLSLLTGVASLVFLASGCHKADQAQTCSPDEVAAPKSQPAGSGPVVVVPAAPVVVQEADSAPVGANWTPTTKQVKVIRAGGNGNLHNFCLHTNGNLLVCWGDRNPKADDPTAAIKVFSPDGDLLATWPLPATPQAISVDPDGTIYLGGAGKLEKLDATGKVLASANSPIHDAPLALDRPALESLAGKPLNDREYEMYKKIMIGRKSSITGMAVTGDDVFVACPSPSDFAYRVYRFDRQLKNAKLVIQSLHGCCGQMDIQAKDGKLWVPHNGRHLVEEYDRDGKKLFSFGKNDRTAADGFGGCCGPKNLRLASDGNVYAAESGPPPCIKCFTKEGKFREVTALPGFHTDCVRVSIDITPDCKRFYILNTEDNAIHVMEKKG